MCTTSTVRITIPVIIPDLSMEIIIKLHFMPTDELTHNLKDSGTTYIFTNDALRSTVMEAAKKSGCVKVCNYSRNMFIGDCVTTDQ